MFPSAQYAAARLLPSSRIHLLYSTVSSTDMEMNRVMLEQVHVYIFGEQRCGYELRASVTLSTRYPV